MTATAKKISRRPAAPRRAAGALQTTGELPAACAGREGTERMFWTAAGALALLTLATFARVAWCGFVNIDDNTYVTENKWVLHGLTRQGLIWAFTTPVLHLYHPLAPASFMVDFELFGLNPAGYHVVNLLLHTVNVLLLFRFLRDLTGLLWRPALLAAVFAVHPLRVESVAWVVERKDVLSFFFGLLALFAYVRYTRHPSAGRYLLIVPPFVLSLLAKPMLVPLPAVLVLLDYWPLKRMNLLERGDLYDTDVLHDPGQLQRRGEPKSPQPGTSAPMRSFGSLVLEKLPLLAISAASTFLAIPGHAFDEGSAFQGELGQSGPRLMNAVVSYVRYVYKMVDYRKLTVFFPYIPWKSWEVAAAGLALLVVTGLVVWQIRRRPWLAVGWFWYLGSLLPVIGVVALGAYSLADRYTYFPMIGILIMAVWSLPESLFRPGRGRPWLAAGSAVVVAALAVSTVIQIGVWRDSVTLWRHAVAVTDGNWMAHNFLGMALQSEKDDAAAALAEFRTVQRMNPKLASAYYDEGVALARLGRSDEALAAYETSLELEPRYEKSLNNIAAILIEKKRFADAVAYCARAIAVDRGYGRAHVTMAIALREMGRFDEAAAHCRRALEINPFDHDAANNLGITLAQVGKTDAAIECFEAAVQMDPDDTAARNNLARALALKDAKSAAEGR